MISCVASVLLGSLEYFYSSVTYFGLMNKSITRCLEVYVRRGVWGRYPMREVCGVFRLRLLMVFVLFVFVAGLFRCSEHVGGVICSMFFGCRIGCTGCLA